MTPVFDVLQRRLKEALDRERALRVKLEQAEVDHAGALENRGAHLVDGELADAKVLAALDRKIIEAASVVAGLVDALKVAGERTAEAQRQIDDAKDQTQRQAETAKVRELIADIDKAANSLTEVSAGCEQALTAAGPLCPEAYTATRLLQSSRHDLRVFTQRALNDLRSYTAALERGGKLRRAISHEPAPNVRMEKPVTQRVYFIEFAKWTIDGKTITAKQYSTHDLAPDLARKAIGCSIALDPAHETAGKLRPIFGDGYAIPADPAICIDIDTVDPGIDLRKVSPQVILAEQAKATAA